MRELLVEIHPDAPEKPAEGSPCNGCGICCLIETCPAGRLRFRQSHGPCPALLWSTAKNRYFCGLLTQTLRHLPWLPARLTGPGQRLLARWIAAGQGCDCTAQCANDF